ncbi:hypothetical protein FRC17_010245 [Serendipita sp. 399]|nr:hypothetical protein FRC17_010245 [Serendipita sp. 399]
MKLSTSLLASLIAGATSVAAHATFQQFWVAGADQAGTCVRRPASNSPVTSVSSSDIACNAGAAASPGYCTVAAGQSVSVEMHQQPGPVIIYMAKVDNALSASGSSARWFKVAQAGLISNDYWGTDSLNANCGKYTFTIPSCIPAGDYLLRAEVIALHVAGSSGGAQFYISCYTLKVTGGGSTSPSTVSFPGAYNANDPGILFNLYGSYSSYQVPGPAVFTCGGQPPASSQTPPRSSSTVRPPSSSVRPPSSTVRPPSSSARPSSTSSANGSTQTLYGQCGGQGWTGPTVCASGTCKASSQYYSQCLP